jgi:protein involved in polysaccharide export with SLBB domain
MGGATSSGQGEKMRSSKIFLATIPFIIALLLLSAHLLGCGNPVAHIAEFKNIDFARTTGGHAVRGDEFSYRLVPYDLINIKFTYHPEEDTKLPLMIRPDGNITLEGSGLIKAAGLTPEQLANVIAEKSVNRMKEPQVIVTVAQYAPRKVYVGGEVKSPGVVLVQDGRNVTPMQAIFERGGFTNTAQVDGVVLIRDGASQNPKIGRLNLSEAMENAVPEQIALLDNDVIYVPMTGVGRADLWVKQHIKDLIPWDLLRPPSVRDLVIQ